MKNIAGCLKGLLVGATISTTFYCLQDRVPLWPVGWGANRYGELGIGSNINSTVPVRLFQQLRDISAKKSVSAGIGADGRVYVWGKVWKGLLAQGINTNCLLPTEVQSLPLGKYKQVQCGQNGLCVVSQQGYVYQWKSSNIEGGFRSIGVENVQKQRKGFIKIEGLQNVKKVSCSTDHTVALTESGEVFTWGKVQKRLGRVGNPNTPLKVSIPYTTSISTGNDFTFAVDREGRLYCWGNNNFGELGLPDIKFTSSPQVVRTLESERVKQISCGNNHVAAVTSDGKVYTWGFGNDGQLGHGDKVDQHIPRKLNLQNLVKQVACGGGHTVFVTDKNEVYTTGRGREGQLGIQQKDQSSHGFSNRPKLVANLSSYVIQKIVCGDNHSFALLTSEFK